MAFTPIDGPLQVEPTLTGTWFGGVQQALDSGSETEGKLTAIMEPRIAKAFMEMLARDADNVQHNTEMSDGEKLDVAIRQYFREKQEPTKEGFRFAIAAPTVEQAVQEWMRQPTSVTIHPTNCTAGFLGAVLNRSRTGDVK